MNKIILIFVFLLSLLLFSCSTTVGDACEKDSDCDAGLICDTTFKEGYCLKVNCDINDDNDCPQESQCTYFVENETAYCLAKCNENDDCRVGYSCQAVPNNKYRVCLPEN